jgi:hypothetical protein
MVFSNGYSSEGTLNNDVLTLTFPRPMNELRIFNDDGAASLQFRFSANEDYKTLLFGENTLLTGIRALNLEMKTVASVAYRVWGLG